MKEMAEGGDARRRLSLTLLSLVYIQFLYRVINQTPPLNFWFHIQQIF